MDARERVRVLQEVAARSKTAARPAAATSRSLSVSTGYDRIEDMIDRLARRVAGLLRDPAPEVRIAAAKALEQMGEAASSVGHSVNSRMGSEEDMEVGQI